MCVAIKSLIEGSVYINLESCQNLCLKNITSNIG